jgi:uncharacterized membrane protein
MNFQVFLSFLLSLIISYVIIKLFNTHPYNKFETPEDYFEYYVVNNVKDIIKTIIIFPIVFLIVGYINKKNSDNLRRNSNIITEVIKELYLSFVTIAKGVSKKSLNL